MSYGEQSVPSADESLAALRIQLERLNQLLERRAAVLSAQEIEALTGLRQPAAQLKALVAQGFHRARRSPLGHVVLERPHFESVSGGAAGQAPDRPRGRVIPPVVKLRSQREAEARERRAKGAKSAGDL